MRAIGVAATGLLKLNRWEIRPTLALDYSDVFSNNAKFTVVSEVGSSDELMLLSSERQKSFTFSPDLGDHSVTLTAISQLVQYSLSSQKLLVAQIIEKQFRKSVVKEPL